MLNKELKFQHFSVTGYVRNVQLHISKFGA
jgi:hypothetical protein